MYDRARHAEIAWCREQGIHDHDVSSPDAGPAWAMRDPQFETPGWMYVWPWKQEEEDLYEDDL